MRLCGQSGSSGRPSSIASAEPDRRGVWPEDCEHGLEAFEISTPIYIIVERTSCKECISNPASCDIVGMARKPDAVCIEPIEPYPTHEINSAGIYLTDRLKRSWTLSGPSPSWGRF